MSIESTSRRRLRAASPFVVALLAAAVAGCDAGPGPAGAPASVAAASPVAFECGAPATAIAALPRADAAPAVVDVEGVVVGQFRAGLGGFFLQSGAGEDDGDVATAEGIFVEYEAEASVPRVGRRLRVRGRWSPGGEPSRAALALREIAQIADCGPGRLPEIVQLRQAPADWSRYAGMRVRVPGPLILTGNETLLRHGELWLAFDERLAAPTETALPGSAAQTRATDNDSHLLIVDDGRRGDYPRRLWHLPDEPGARAPYRAGSRVSGVDGIVDRRFGGWRVQLIEPLAAVEQAPRPSPPARDASLLRIASFNVLNYFNGDGRGRGFPTERGAASPQAQQRQRDKLIAAMAALDADVLALMEIENDGYGRRSAIADLAAALDAAAPNSRHAYVDAGAAQLGADVIAVGLIYRADRVRTVGAPGTLSGAPFDDDSRVPLAQAFVAVGADDTAAFLVVVNHFKSKGCREAGAADADRGDGQACFAGARVASARRLIDWLGGDPAGIGATPALIVGDLNAYTREDPLRLLSDHGYVDLLAGDDDAPTYTYVFRGQSGRLDHALAGAALVPRVRAAGVWHINADELPEFDYDGDARSQRRLYTADPYRSSDHDPVWIDIAY